MKRIRLLFKIWLAWRKYPELRLCQLLANAACANGWLPNDLFSVSDSLVEQAIDAVRTDGF